MTRDGRLELLTLKATRHFLHGRRRLLVAGFAILFGGMALLAGGMLSLFPTQGGYIIEVIGWGAPQDWWYYPEVLAVQPWGILQLPFFPTLAMTLVAVGAGSGAATAVLAAREVLRARRGQGGPGGPSGVACGAAPGVASLATIGACCCTSCAGSVGIAAVAAAAGSSATALLGLEWYLPAFQLVLVYVLLLVQERSLRGETIEPAPRPFPTAGALVGRWIVRGLLLVGGVTWGMAVLVEWTVQGPSTASAALWYHWVVEHGVVASLAVALALAPRELSRLAARAARSFGGAGLRSLAAVGGVTWAIGVPPGLVGAGLGGTVNELLGAAGVPAAYGGSGLDSALSVALVFHWAVQHLLLGGTAIALAARPVPTADWMLGGRRFPSTEPASPAGSGRTGRAMDPSSREFAPVEAAATGEA